MAANTRLKITPTGGPLATDITGVDLSQQISDETFSAIYQAWNDHLVLRFRGQQLDDDQLADFSRRFGELDNAPVRPQNIPYHPSRPEIAVISNIVEGGAPIGGLGNSELVWHQDMSYQELPPKASLLYGIETPPDGGDTLFYNLYTALETLPAELRKRIEGRTCKHDATHNSAGQVRATHQGKNYTNETRPGAIHPLIARHPETGRDALYLGRRPNAWIVGLTDTESDELLDALWAHIENGTHHWTQNWQPGDLVIWDNRCTLHRRGPLDPAERRLMHRTQVRAEARPVAA